MAGFMTRRESRKQYESIGGGNFNDAYRSQKDKLRQSGLRGRDLRQAARQAVIDDQNLTNIQNTALQNSEQYAPTEDAITGMEMRDYDQNEKQMQRDNYEFRQILNARPIEVPLMPAQIQSTPTVQQEEPNYNSMSFNDAFRAARKLNGKDGTFKWKGQTYGLKYADEVAAEKTATAKTRASGTIQKTGTDTTVKPSSPVVTTSQTAPQTTIPSASKTQVQVTTPTTQVDNTQSSQPSNLAKPAVIVARRDTAIQNSSAAPEVATAQVSQNNDISKPWNKTYQLGNRTLTHSQMEDYLFDGKLDDPNLYHGAPTMSMIPEEYAKNTDTSRFTFGRPISTSELYTDRASNVTPRQQYTQQDLNNELGLIDSQTWYNQKARRQAINNAYAKYNAGR